MSGSVDNPSKRGPKKLHYANWKPGQSGNPKGKPKGSRNKLVTAFLDAVYAKWQKKGDAVLDRIIKENPVDFMRIVAALVPRHFKVTDERENLTDEQRATRLLGIFRALTESGNLPAEFGRIGQDGAGRFGFAGELGNGQIIEVQAVSEAGGVSQQSHEGDGADRG